MGAADQQKMTPDQMSKVFGEFASLFAAKVNCSEDPYNPRLGFNLHDVTLAECQAAKTKKIKENPDIQIQLGAATCISQIVDESDNSAAVWIEFGNTGAIRHDKFKVRGAVRYTFDADAKITSYHTVYDTYNLLHHGEDQEEDDEQGNDEQNGHEQGNDDDD